MADVLAPFRSAIFIEPKPVFETPSPVESVGEIGFLRVGSVISVSPC